MANCTQCGSAVTEGATFCAVCGAPLTAAEAPAETTSEMPASDPGAAGYQAPPDPGNTGYLPPQDPGPAGYQQPPAGGYQAPPGASYQPPPGAGAAGAGAQRAGTSLPTYKADLANLTTLDRVCAVATFVLFISIFFSWFSACVGPVCVSVSGTWHGYMWITVILCLIVLGIFAAKLGWGKLPWTLPVTDSQLVLAVTGLNLLLTIISFITKPTGTSWAFGAWLGLIAALVALAPTVWPAVQKQMGQK